MTSPFEVFVCFNAPVKNGLLSTHTTLANAKRAIGVRWANLKKKWAHAPGYSAAFEIQHKGKRVYGRGGYV